MSRVIAIDPGQSTGVAINNDGKYETYIMTEVTQVWDLIHLARPNAVVLENFSTAGNISKDGLHTVRVIGGVMAVCHLYGIPLTLHSPQKRYAFMARASGMLVGKTDIKQHNKDALAHLLAWEYYENERHQ